MVSQSHSLLTNPVVYILTLEVIPGVFWFKKMGFYTRLIFVHVRFISSPVACGQRSSIHPNPRPCCVPESDPHKPMEFPHEFLLSFVVDHNQVCTSSLTVHSAVLPAFLYSRNVVEAFAEIHPSISEIWLKVIQFVIGQVVATALEFCGFILVEINAQWNIEASLKDAQESKAQKNHCERFVACCGRRRPLPGRCLGDIDVVHSHVIVSE